TGAVSRTEKPSHKSTFLTQATEANAETGLLNRFRPQSDSRNRESKDGELDVLFLACVLACHQSTMADGSFFAPN
ncbi:MAG: hypothetical protein P1U77_17730, partial [Rubripirellula sp.]|nr:hypothetical protein [Rubripirellula sp.]